MSRWVGCPPAMDWPSPPPSPAPSLVALTDLPPELLARIPTAINEGATAAPDSTVPHPTDLDGEAGFEAPLVGVRGWTAAAGAAGACCALRAAAADAVSTLELDFGLEEGDPIPEGEDAYQACRAARNARTATRLESVKKLLLRHTVLMELRLRLDRVASSAAEVAVGHLVAGLYIPAAPQLLALSIVVNLRIPVPACLGALPPVQRRLEHLVLLVNPNPA